MTINNGFDNETLAGMKPQQESNWWLVRIVWLSITVLIVFIIAQFCPYLAAALFCQYVGFCSDPGDPDIYCTYFALTLITGLLLADQVLRYKKLEQKMRKEDWSIVENTLAQARRLYDNYKARESDDEYSDDVDPEGLKEEINRVAALKEYYRNEYEVLQLWELMVPFWNPLDLVESARAYLLELEDYAQDSKYRYEWKQFDDRKRNVEKSIDGLEKTIMEQPQVADQPDHQNARKLRARVIALLEHITDYHYSWGVGSAMIRALTIYECEATTLLLMMGILPLIHPAEVELTVFNWAVLGAAGSLTAALQLLRQEQAIEVGYSEGKQEIRKGMLGAVLGLVAGIIVYALVNGGLLSGDLFPNEASQSLIDIGKSIFWALAAGYSFERVFDRMRWASTNFTQ